MRSFGLYYSVDSTRNPSIKESNIAKDKERKCLKDDQSSSIGIVEVHCNLWKMLEKKCIASSMLRDPKYLYFLDIGLMFNPSIRNIILHLPYKSELKDFTDLGEKLVNQELCSLIFNENVKTQWTAGTYHAIEVGKKRLYVYPLSAQNVKFDDPQEKSTANHRYASTNIHIKLNSDPQTSNPEVSSAKMIQLSESSSTDIENFIYIRFRLSLSPQQLTNIKNEEFLTTDIIQSIFSKNEMFDFRINDDREIDRKIDEKLRFQGFMPFRMNKVHFLFMTDTRNSIINSSLPCQTRFLETEKWDSYVDCNIPECMLAHHWRDKKEKAIVLKPIFINEDTAIPDSNRLVQKITKTSLSIAPHIFPIYISQKSKDSFPSFKLFFMLTYPHRSWSQIWFYAIIAIVLGCVGSVIATFMFDSESSKFDRSFFLYFVGAAAVILLAFWGYLKHRSKVKFR